ncbi:progonadoliberin-1-like [Alosa pseudoharengus]|uniref:progonadoliberin-1-like n=1 Tax=Alosa pseudoharengus TaxID=34774 RepID=UPI003F8BC6F9
MLFLSPHRQNKDASCLCYLKRMEGKRALLWLLLIAAAAFQLSAQHWSHGLSPGGKREAHTLSEVMEGLRKRSASLCGSEYRDGSPYKRPDRLEQLLNLMEGENVAYD